jgi:PadR family transcriptional regulator, regulatory protein PadR
MCRRTTYHAGVGTSVAPMREPTYFVLAALLAGPLHGYAIIKRAEEMSGGRVRLATGTLYTALDRLTAEGYVRLVSEETVAGRIRRSYGLTDAGSAALRAEAQRMAEVARLVTGVQAAPGPARLGKNRIGKTVRPA